MILNIMIIIYITVRLGRLYESFNFAEKFQCITRLAKAFYNRVNVINNAIRMKH